MAAGSGDVQRFLHARSRRARDDRTLRTRVDAVAHPGKLRGLPAGDLRDGLARLHAQAAAGDHAGVAHTARALAEGPGLHDASLHERLCALASQAAPHEAPPADAEADATPGPDLRRYLALQAQARAAGAGTPEAAERGAVASGRGAATEAALRAAFERVAGVLDARAAALGASAARHRVVHQLRVPAGFPGVGDHAKSEWDVALLRAGPSAEGDALLLLGEAKASPEAAVHDLPRLLRGLQRLAQAPEGPPLAFPSADGEVSLAGATLRRLRPEGGRLPWRVLYGCDAEAGPAPPLLSPATRGLLMADPACLRFAWALMRGAAPSPDDLRPVWQAVVGPPPWRVVRDQHDTARRVRASMLHPDDLVASVRAALEREEGEEGGTAGTDPGAGR